MNSPARHRAAAGEDRDTVEKAKLLDDSDSPVQAAPRSKLPVAVLATLCTLVVLIGVLSARYGKPAREHKPVGSVGEIVSMACKRALGGGLSGAIAGVAQVLLLMWLRTTMNYQYRYGSSTCASMRTLYQQGGIPRFYQGLPYALLQTPLSRFGDTAANTGVLALLAATAFGAALPVWLRTALASATAALWRMVITPLDTLKTTLQVEGRMAYSLLLHKARRNGVGELWAGAVANAVANFVGGYPWFLTFNTLDELVPGAPPNELTLKLLRSAMLGVCATAVSDCLSNSIRVIKTTRQTSATSLTYHEATQLILLEDGLRGLLCRGLGTRLLANVIQAALFTVIWKQLEAQMKRFGLA